MLRLLKMELEEHPDDPFVLYNLGAVYLTQGALTEAVELFRRSLERSHPADNLVPKLQALTTRALHQLGRRDDALAACRKGRIEHPHDPELLFWEAMMLREKNDLAGAEKCWLEILHAPRRMHFTSMDASMQGYRARHFLAEIYRDQGRTAEAEAQWRLAVGDCPTFTAAWRNLGEIYLGQSRWAELAQAVAAVKHNPREGAEGEFLEARAHLARKEFAPARAILESMTAADPRALRPKVALSHVLLQEGVDWSAGEQVLRDILAIEPNFAEAAHNLRVLLGRQPERRTEFIPFEDGQRTESIPFYERRVSLCMIVKNEEENLPACLDSVKDLVDEIIVVDTGSTDRTREIARERGARVFDFAWVDSFAAARNECLRHATGDWIFWMDADDRLDEENRGKLRALFAELKDDNAAYVMKCLCLPDERTKTATEVDHLRLFRKYPGMRWRFRVHEQILPAARQLRADVRWSQVVIHHTGYRDPELRARKLQRDLRLLLLDQAENPDNPFVLFNLGSIYQEQKRPADALPLFRRSLELSDPSDSIVRKLYSLVAQCHNQLGKNQEGLAACRDGRKYYPDDIELLFQEGIALRNLGDAAGAKVS